MNQYNAEFWNALDELVNNSEIKILIGCTEEKTIHHIRNTQQNAIYERHFNPSII